MNEQQSQDGKIVRSVYSSISYSKVEVRGTWGIQGPQHIGTPNGAPTWVADALKDEKILAVAYVTENGGAIYQRLSS